MIINKMDSEQSCSVTFDKGCDDKIRDIYGILQVL